MEEIHTGFSRGNQKEGDNLEGPGEDNIKMDLKETAWQ